MIRQTFEQHLDVEVTLYIDIVTTFFKQQFSFEL
jgi:hypothetical protein